MKLSFVLLTMVVLLGCTNCSATVSESQRQVMQSNMSMPWRLVWSDDFNGSLNFPPDTTKWHHETGGQGWKNNGELQYYTDRTDNAFLDGQGHLVIRARRETYNERSFTSARLTTEGKFEPLYGRMEARIKLPYGQGIWPAFWMLGSNIHRGTKWPDCGEIDIMENIGKLPNMNNAGLHGPGYSGGHSVHHRYQHPVPLHNDFHVYAMEWEPNTIRYYLDGQLYQTFTPADLPRGKSWVYEHPFYLILNVAVGGSFPGSPDESTQFPQDMTVDYVRVYQR